MCKADACSGSCVIIASLYVFAGEAINKFILPDIF